VSERFHQFPGKEILPQNPFSKGEFFHGNTKEMIIWLKSAIAWLKSATLIGPNKWLMIYRLDFEKVYRDSGIC
jgi:hypothetical protein